MKKAEEKKEQAVATKTVAKASPRKAASAAKKSSTPISHGVGRRKSSVARVWLRKGSGAVTVNGEDYKKYFVTLLSRHNIEAPFRASQQANQFDIAVNVCGGGKESQSGAIKLGFARALVKFDETLRTALRAAGLLTVDSRVKERKKPGQKAARRKFQFVKR
ncbi:30S ribosomal protein S9 [bacterium]|jgi:small subunit ribosomal protein S9|nr:30S ribosomal protein S9 [bacterium]MBT5015250.1 30S ribosomal protein S9 [bacterium]